MKVLFAVVALLAAVAVHARPGGYTANGGVFQHDPSKQLDYMDEARHAGKKIMHIQGG